MSQIFISYSRKDEDEVIDLVDELKTRGINVWLDTQQVEIGDKWIDSIRQAISHSDKILVMLSPNSADSEWVQLEVNAALDRVKTELEILPVIIAGEPKNVVPARLKNLNYFDARHKDSNTIEQLASRLRSQPVTS